jgi:hypothetical protein
VTIPTGLFLVLQPFKLYSNGKLVSFEPQDDWPILGDYFAGHFYSVTRINYSAIKKLEKLKKVVLVPGGSR